MDALDDLGSDQGAFCDNAFETDHPVQQSTSQCSGVASIFSERAEYAT